MEKNTTESVPAPEKSYDEKKIEALYRKLQPFAKYTAEMKNRGDLSEDLLQDSAVIMLQLMARNDHPFASWEPHQQIGYQRKVISHRLIAMSKEDGRFVSSDDEWYGSKLASIQADEQYQPHDVQERASSYEAIERALVVLTGYERAVWILHERYEWSYKRIAKRLRKRNLEVRTVVAIRKAKRSAKKKLLKALEQKSIIA